MARKRAAVSQIGIKSTQRMSTESWAVLPRKRMSHTLNDYLKQRDNQVPSQAQEKELKFQWWRLV